MKNKLSKMLAVFTVLAFFGVHAVFAYTFPSTNELNKNKQVPGRVGENAPYVEFVSNDVGEVTLRFVNESNSLAFFEYRIDGVVKETGTSHPIVTPGDFIYSGKCVDGRNPPKPAECSFGAGPRVETFSATEYVEIRLALGGERDWDFDWTRFDVLPAPFVRSAEIIAPTVGQEVSGTVSFDAALTDKDGNDNVQWAVRKGTCAANTNTVLGNVDGRSDTYTWDHYNFHASADTSSWAPGSYCFVFNPTESAGDTAIRETREFVVIDLDLDDDGILNDVDICPTDTEADGWLNDWGTNRWQVMIKRDVLGWYQNKPAKKGNTVATYGYDIGYTYGCNGHQILDLLTATLGENAMNGHYKFGLSSSVLEDFHKDLNDGVLDGRYFIDTFKVPVKVGTGITTYFSTVSGLNYYLEVSGTYRFQGTGIYGIADAEWTYRNDAYALPVAPHGWTLGEDNYPSVLGLDVLVDGNNIDWGDYTDTHIYNTVYAGTGNPLIFSIYDSAYGDNGDIDSGMNVKVYADL